MGRLSIKISKGEEMKFLCWLGFHKFMHISCNNIRDGRKFCFHCLEEEMKGGGKNETKRNM